MDATADGGTLIDTIVNADMKQVISKETSDPVNHIERCPTCSELFSLNPVIENIEDLFEVPEANDSLISVVYELDNHVKRTYEVH